MFGGVYFGVPYFRKPQFLAHFLQEHYAPKARWTTFLSFSARLGPSEVHLTTSIRHRSLKNP